MNLQIRQRIIYLHCSHTSDKLSNEKMNCNNNKNNTKINRNESQSIIAKKLNNSPVNVVDVLGEL